jgi:hypothetical protein
MSSEARHLVVGTLVLLSGACGAAQTTTASADLAPEIGALPKQLDEEYRQFANNCSKCHGIERALNAPVTDRRHWELYVAKMKRTPGSGISDREAPPILAFLYWYADRKAGRPTEYDSPTEPAVPVGVEAKPEPVFEPGPQPVPPSETPASVPPGENTP